MMSCARSWARWRLWRDRTPPHILSWFTRKISAVAARVDPPPFGGYQNFECGQSAGASSDMLHSSAGSVNAHTRCPWGVLSSYPLDGRLFYLGWPRLGGSDASHYLGPLPKRCGCNDHWSSERTPADQRLRAVGDSILQPGFASYLAALLLRACGSASSITELLRKGAGLGVSERVRECEDHSDVETNCDETSSEEPYHQDRDQLRKDEGQKSALDQLALQSLGLWDLMDGVYGNFGGNSDDFENGGFDDFGEDRNSEGKVKKCDEQPGTRKCNKNGSKLASTEVNSSNSTLPHDRGVRPRAQKCSVGQYTPSVAALCGANRRAQKCSCRQ